MPLEPPSSLGVAGAALWAAVCRRADLDGSQRALLEQACRSVDYQQQLVGVLTGPENEQPLPQRLVRHIALQACTTSDLVAAMRLADERGRRPQRRGARGVYGLRALRGSS